jgi:hypothetical protein
MFRTPALMALALAACSPGEGEANVVRLDLDRIAAATAARDASPGFAALAPPSGAQPGVSR